MSLASYHDTSKLSPEQEQLAGWQLVEITPGVNVPAYGVVKGKRVLVYYIR
jgi:hypothetical protein